MVRKGSMDQPVPPEQLALPVPMVSMERQAQPVRRVPRARPERMDHKVLTDPPAQLAQPEPMGLMVRLEQRVILDSTEPPAQLEQRELMVLLVLMVLMVPRERPERQVLMVLLDLMVRPEQTASMVRRVQC